jgi:iron-sulfur cluster repair protein YtfE (RIC family)
VTGIRTTGANFAFARYEHTHLTADLDEIRTAAYAVGRVSAPDAVNAVRHVRDWLVTDLAPHAAWENLVVYPEFDRLAATSDATRVMRLEHRQIEAMAFVLDADIEQLRSGPVSHLMVCDIRAHLLGLESLLRTHIKKEDELLRPEIDSPDER